MKLFLLIATVLSTIAAEEFSLRRTIELKYASRVSKFEIISITSKTKALWFDWEKEWWGTFNVVELDATGRPLYWYDIREFPSAQSIASVRAVNLSGKSYLEVIDRTHMGNESLYLYETRPGVLELRLKVRVAANLSDLHFEPQRANIEYRDSDGDGDDDLVISALWKNDALEPASGAYFREFRNHRGKFEETKSKRSGPSVLMD